MASAAPSSTATVQNRADLQRVLRSRSALDTARRLHVFCAGLSSRKHLFGTVFFPELPSIMAAVFAYDSTDRT